MSQNGQIRFKNFAAKLQDFEIIFAHFGPLYIEGLKIKLH